MERRQFLRQACQACAAIALVPAVASLESCSATKALAVENGVLSVPKSAFGKGGSAIVKVVGAEDKLIVVKRPDGSYTALSLNCPHKNGPVQEKGGQLVCKWHGSTFDHEGKVLKGPSRSGRKRFPVEEAGEVLKVKVA